MAEIPNCINKVFSRVSFVREFARHAAQYVATLKALFYSQSRKIFCNQNILPNQKGDMAPIPISSLTKEMAKYFGKKKYKKSVFRAP
jgi:hypothetical protein